MPETTGSSRDPRLQAAEEMCERLAHHLGATPGIRRLAGDLVSALRRTLEDERELAANAGSPAGQRDGTPEDPMREALDRLEAQASDLLGALARLHGVIVRRDERGSERALAEAKRLLSDSRVLDDLTRMLEGDDGQGSAGR